MIDDTYNAVTPPVQKLHFGPLAGATAAPGGKKVVVTPGHGLRSPGPLQARGKQQILLQAAGAVATQAACRGLQTQRRAPLWAGRGGQAGLPVRSLSGNRAAKLSHVVFRKPRPSGDAVLYENDLPDHYP